MKFALVLLAVFGLAYGAAPHKGARKQVRELQHCIDAILANIDTEGLANYVLTSFESDPNGQAIKAYLQGADFKAILDTVYPTEGAINLLEYVSNEGVDIYTYVNAVLGYLGYDPITPPTVARKAHAKPLRIWKEFMDGCMVYIDMTGIMNTALDLLSNDADFQAFLARLGEDDVKAVVSAVRHLPQTQALVATLEGEGIDIESYWNLLCSIVNWCDTFKVKGMLRELNTAFDELATCVDSAGLEAWLLDALVNDADGQRVLAYLKSADFKTILDFAYSFPKTKEFIQYLSDEGLAVYDWINAFLAFLGYDPITPPTAAIKKVHVRHTRTLVDFINHLESFINQELCMSIVMDLVQNDPGFQALYAYIATPEVAEVVNAVRELPEVQDLIATLESEGIDIDGPWNTICTILNWC